MMEGEIPAPAQPSVPTEHAPHTPERRFQPPQSIEIEHTYLNNDPSKTHSTHVSMEEKDLEAQQYGEEDPPQTNLEKTPLDLLSSGSTIDPSANPAEEGVDFVTQVGPGNLQLPWNPDVEMSKIETAHSELHQTFLGGKTRDIQFRRDQLLALYNSIQAHQDDIAEAVYSDLRRDRRQALFTEVNQTCNEICRHLNHMAEWCQDEKPTQSVLFASDRIRVMKQPYGVVLVMGAWNFPFELSVRPAVSAIAAGNCVVLKPSEKAPNTAMVIAKIIEEAIDPSICRCINGGIPIAKEIVSKKWNYICYTGSGMVGKLIQRAAADHLTPTLLELGGQNPVIVDETAYVDTAAKRVMWGRHINCGQLCIAPEYVLCHPSVKDEFVASCKKYLVEFFTSDPKTCEAYPRIINGQHWEFVNNLREQARDECKEFWQLGEAPPDKADKFIPPTIVVDPSAKLDLVSSESFGPVLSIHSEPDISTAIQRINSKDTPLALYVFSTSQSNIDQVLTYTQSGGACINDCVFHYATGDTPFGGCGESGMGAYHGKIGFDTFSHHRTVLHRSQVEVSNFARYAPFDYLSMLDMTLKETPKGCLHLYIEMLLTFIFTYCLYPGIVAILWATKTVDFTKPVFVKNLPWFCLICYFLGTDLLSKWLEWLSECFYGCGWML